MSNIFENIRIRVIVPAVLSSLLILGACITGVIWLERNQIDDEFQGKRDGVTKMFDTRIHNNVGLIERLASDLYANDELGAAWMSGDRERALQLAGPILADLKEKFNITHIYMVNPDRSAFLRVHKPNEFGDPILHSVVEKAALENRPSHGIELGKHGTFSLRVVKPWLKDGRLIGYLELAQEVDEVATAMNQMFQVELLFAIDKKFLQRDSWQEGRKMMGHRPDWDDFTSFTLVKSAPRLAESELDRAVGSLGFASQLAPFPLECNGKSYRGAVEPLIDALGRQVGGMIILEDVTEAHARTNLLLNVLLGIALLVGSILMLIFWVYLGQIQNNINNSYESLSSEITQRKQAQDKLSLTQFAMDHAPEAAIWTDPDSKLIYVNEAACEMLGYSAEVLLQMNVGDIDPHFTEDVWPLLWQELSSKGTITFETWYHTSDGNVRPVEVSMNRVRFGDREINCTFARDVTERRRSIEQQKQLESKLLKAEKMESLGLLAGGVAHDLNNMLGPLVGYPELILRKLPEDSPVTKYVQRIHKAAVEATDVVSDLLTLARRGRYQMVPTNLNSVVRDYLDSASFISLQKRTPAVEVDLTLTDDCPMITGSATHLFKVVMNLIVNAYDAMPDGGKLSISTWPETIDETVDVHEKLSPGNYLVLKVRDSGVGIEDADLEKIFDPYFSKKPMGKSGTGLGLSIVYGIMDDHGGSCDLWSALGIGTEFALYFPVLVMDNHQEQVEITQEITGDESLLIISSIEEQRDLTTEMIASLGYRIKAAANEDEIGVQIHSESFELVVLEFSTGDYTKGLATLEYLRKLSPDQKTMVLGSSVEPDLEEKLLQLGVSLVVRKPFTRDSIGTAIRGLLNETPATTVS